MNGFGKWLDSHKTKIIGFVLVVAGALQANTTLLQTLMTERQFGWFTVIVGCIVAGFGFLNSRQPDPPNETETGVS